MVQFIDDFQNKYEAFNQSVNSIKTIIIDHLHNGSEINITLNSISTLISNLLPYITLQLEQNNKLITNRITILNEYNELLVMEFLFNNKPTILKYFDEYKHKEWINICKSKLNINVSRKNR